MTNGNYTDDIFRCEIQRLKNINQELYKRFIKPMFFPLLTIICCFLLTTSKEQNNYTFKIIKIFIFIFLILVMSEVLMRYIENSKVYLILFMLVPFLFFSFIYSFLIYKVKYG